MCCYTVVITIIKPLNTKHLSKNKQVRTNIFQLKRDEETLDNIKQYYVECASKNMKYQALVSISSILSVGQGIIFCKTKETARWLAKEMLNDKYVVSMLTGELDVVKRAEVLKRFVDLLNNYYELIEIKRDSYFLLFLLLVVFLEL